MGLKAAKYLKIGFVLQCLVIALLVVLFCKRHSNMKKVVLYREYSSKMATKPATAVSITKPVLILWWSPFFGERISCAIPNKFCDNISLRKCSVPCEMTSDLKRVSDASVMIVHANDPSPLPPKEYSHIPLILLTLENRMHALMLANEAFMVNFNYLMSYRLDVADFFITSFHTPTVEPRPIPFANKTGFIAAVFSNCEKARTAYLKELMKYIHVDSYGGCLQNKKGLAARYSVGYFKELKTKMLRNYKFTIVFLNQDCDYFVDDQLTHALTAGTVPVYMGTNKVDELLGGNLKNSIIKVRDFDTPKKLAEFLTKVGQNETLYNKYLKWKYEGFQFPDSFKRSLQFEAMRYFQNPQFCNICETIAKHRKRGEYKKKGSVKADNCIPRKIEDWIKS